MQSGGLARSTQFFGLIIVIGTTGFFVIFDVTGKFSTNYQLEDHWQR